MKERIERKDEGMERIFDEFTRNIIVIIKGSMNEGMTRRETGEMEHGYARTGIRRGTRMACTLHAQRGARNGRLCPQRGSVCVSGRYRFLSIDSPVNTAPLSISNVTASSLLLRLLRNTRIYRESLDGT